MFLVTRFFSRYERTMAFLPQYISLADRAEVFDNSGEGLVRVLSKKNGIITFSEDARRFEWVETYLKDFE